MLSAILSSVTKWVAMFQYIKDIKNFEVADYDGVKCERLTHGISIHFADKAV